MDRKIEEGEFDRDNNGRKGGEENGIENRGDGR